VGGASARDRSMTARRRKWRKEQHRYLEILREIRSHLTRNGMCSIVRALRRATPEYLERGAIGKTRDQAREIAGLAERMCALLTRSTIAPELRLRMQPEMESLLASLEAVRHQCLEAEKNQPSGDQVLLWCASTAFSLVLQFSDKMPTSGSARSPYRVVASLLYEVVTGEHGHDLRRACNAHLKAMRAV
jgi:hypothetical protein